jgi:hypothetical protein
MGRKSTDAPPEPVSMEAILKYKSTLKAEDGPSIGHFKVDFSENSPERSPWNHQLCDIFVDDYVKRGLPISEVKSLSVFFMTYLATLQAANRKATATAEQAQAYKASSQRNRIEKRKNTVSPSSDLQIYIANDNLLSGSALKLAPCVTMQSIGSSNLWKI